jgi:hypothetical protein
LIRRGLCVVPLQLALNTSNKLATEGQEGERLGEAPTPVQHSIKKYFLEIINGENTVRHAGIYLYLEID